MSKIKDAFVTDQEPPDGFVVDPEYMERPAPRLKAAPGGIFKLPSEIYKLMPKIMAAVGPVAKSQVNTKFKGQAIEDIYNALNKAMSEHGVFTSSEILETVRDERKTSGGGALLYTILKVRYTFWAPDGSSVSTTVQGEGMDAGDKSANKAMSAAHKYALKQAFLIPTESDDPDRESHEVAPRHDDSRKGYDRRSQTQTFQKPVPNPDTIQALLACEDLQTLKEMWSKLDKSEHRLYEGVKEQRKEELQKLATVDQDIPQ